MIVCVVGAGSGSIRGAISSDEHGVIVGFG